MNDPKKTNPSKSESDLLSLIEVLHGDLPSPEEITLVSVVRNNPFLIEAFLNHHRALGVNRFLILDDWSDEPFLSFLTSQPDVTVLRVPMRFPERLSWTDLEGNVNEESAGGTYKDLISRHMIKHPWSMVVDSDEFLMLAPGLRDLSHFFAQVNSDRFGVFGAQMVDMVPEVWPLGALEGTPQSFADLVALYPLFKPAPAWERVCGQVIWNPDSNAISDIFRFMDVYSGPPPVRAIKKIVRPMFPSVRAFTRSDVSKVPLVGPRYRHLRRTHHDVSAPIDSPMVLAVAHFTFTHDFPGKVKAYLEMNSGKNRFASWTRYEAYSRLLKKMERKGGVDFRRFELTRFIDEQSFVQAGIFEGVFSETLFR